MTRWLPGLTLALALPLVACGDDPNPPNTDAGDAGTDAADASDDVAADIAVDGDTGTTDTTLDVAADADTSPDATPDATPDTGPPPPCEPVALSETLEVAPLGEWSVLTDPVSGAWGIAAPGQNPTWDDAGLRSAGACAQVGDRVVPGLRYGTGAPEVEMFFGAWRTSLDPLVWADTVADAFDVDATADAVTLTWALTDGGRIALVFTLEDGGLRMEVETTATEDAGFELNMGCDAEGYFGLGSQVIGMNLRGNKFPLWTQEQGNSKSERGEGFPLQNILEAAYAPMGVLHTTDGWSAVVTSDTWQQLDVCETDDALLTLQAWHDAPGLWLVAGTPRERMATITARIGRLASEPAPWTFAPWNDAVGGPDRLATVAETLRENDIPSSAIWSEDWIGGDQTLAGFRLSYAWEWDPATYPDLPETIEALHAEGFAFLGYFNTFVPNTTRMYTEGEEAGYLALREDGSVYTISDPAFRDAGLVDLTNPDAAAWFRGYMVTAADELGIDGWMADFTEWMPHDAVLSDGRDPWQYHNRWPLDFQQLNRDAMTDVHADESVPNNWSFFARSGWASTASGGSSGRVATMWSGDQETDWEYTDGFPTIVPIGVNLGLAGVSIYGSDIAGYTSLAVPNTTKELFYRWSMAGALMPLMRTHHGSDECGNWAFDRDAETLVHYRRWAGVHVLLYPLFDELVTESMANGMPLMRHPWLVEPDVASLWDADHDFQWFIGDDLLMAPVFEEGAATREVIVPSADWWPLFGDAPLDGWSATPRGDAVVQTVAAPVTETPVFVRPGTALPLLAEAVDSFYPHDHDTWTSLADVDGRYRVALYPTADGTIDDASVGAATVAGTGWDDANLGAVTLDDVPMSGCEETEGALPCVDVTAGVIRFAASSGMLRAGDATLTLTGDTPQEWHVGIGGAAWGEYASTDQVPDLDVVVPPPCEE